MSNALWGCKNSAMEGNDKLTIRLHVNNQDFPIIINRKDEMFYREAAKTINTTLNNYRQHFPGKSDSETLLMTLIDIAVRHEQEKTHNDTSEYDDILAALTQEIEAEL